MISTNIPACAGMAGGYRGRKLFRSVIGDPEKATVDRAVSGVPDAPPEVREVREMVRDVDLRAPLDASGMAGSDLPHKTLFGVVE